MMRIPHQIGLVLVSCLIFIHSPNLQASIDNALDAVQKGDFLFAFKEFKSLAEQGDREAQYNLAFLYKQGKGVMEDKGKAAEWFRKAADQGLADAQYQLGNMYDKGDGVAQNASYAFVWYRMAAQQGDPLSQTNLGVLYANGEGVRQDLVMAYVWFNLAAAQGIGLALDNREILADSMSPEMLQNVREISREYFRQYVEPFLDKRHEKGANLRNGAFPEHRHPEPAAGNPAATAPHTKHY